MAERKSRIISTLLTASMIALSISLATSRLDAAEYALMPGPQTVHVGHFSPTLKSVALERLKGKTWDEASSGSAATLCSGKHGASTFPCGR